jgi:DNA-binding beta-propeller fold protein YncE
VGFATSVAVDSSGDVFVADGTGNEILELPTASGEHLGVEMTAGTLSVVAGDGSAGESGDAQIATSAQLDDPQGVAADPEGDLFIADTENCEIREVASHSATSWGIRMLSGHIYTIAGTGTCGETADGGRAGRAELWDPVDVVVGPGGNLLVSDGGGEEVLDLPPVSGTYYGTHIAADHLTPVAGMGMYGPYLVDGLPATGQTAELNSPAEIAADAAGDLFIADPYSSCIREVPARDVTQRGRAMSVGDMYTVAGVQQGSVGVATRWIGPETLYPSGVAVAPDGAIVYSDQGANVVRELPAG